VNILITPEGTSPFEEWFLNLRDRKAKIVTRLGRVAAGNFGDHKYLCEGVYELRLTYGKGIRIYYGKEEDTIILLLLGFENQLKPEMLNKPLNIGTNIQENNYGKSPL
jgi:putative addiction module killer protein